MFRIKKSGYPFRNSLLQSFIKLGDKITDWYNEAQAELGKRFQKTAIKHINSLNKAPQIYAIRYKEIRCVLVKKFPTIYTPAKRSLQLRFIPDL